MQTKYADVRPSPIAGSWYPKDAPQLREQLLAYLANVDLPAFSGEVSALILPHAGYYYSGQTAAYALKAIQGKTYQRIIILSPSHQAYRADLITSGHDAYQTPLGMVPVDQKTVSQLARDLAGQGLDLKAVRQDREHAIEIELPFLQIVLDEDFSIIPISIVNQSPNLAKRLSTILSELILSFPEGEEVLLIASSDLSHYHHQKQANSLDNQLIRRLKDFSVEDFFRDEAAGKFEACGYAAIATVLLTAQKLGAKQLTIADYRTSGDISGDFSSVVGYLSAIISEGKDEK
jgi:AmmeMemoRadiSam system protein B